MLSVPLVLATSSCAVAGNGVGSGSDLGWLWGLIGVVALFVLGGVAYKIRNRRSGTPRYDTYEAGKYNSTDEPYKGPGAQHPQSRPPIGF